MSRSKEPETIRCTQCRLEAQFEADGVVACEYHIRNVLWTLLAMRYDVIVKAVTKS